MWLGFLWSLPPSKHTHTNKHKMTYKCMCCFDLLHHVAKTTLLLKIALMLCPTYDWITYSQSRPLELVKPLVCVTRAFIVTIDIMFNTNKRWFAHMMASHIRTSLLIIPTNTSKQFRGEFSQSGCPRVFIITSLTSLSSLWTLPLLQTCKLKEERVSTPL